MYSDGPRQNTMGRVKKKMFLPRTIKLFIFKPHIETSPVKTWMERKVICVALSVDCLMCETPQSIDYSWNAIWFWNNFKAHLKKNHIYISLRTILYVSLHRNVIPHLDVLIVIGLFSIFSSRITIRHSEPKLQTPLSVFIEFLIKIEAVVETGEART